MISRKSTPEHARSCPCLSGWTSKSTTFQRTPQNQDNIGAMIVVSKGEVSLSGSIRRSIFSRQSRDLRPQLRGGGQVLRPGSRAEGLPAPRTPVEESIYTDDPVRVYLREMGAVPLLTREGEVDLARRMERGKLRMQKAISRSAAGSAGGGGPGRAAAQGRHRAGQPGGSRRCGRRHPGRSEGAHRSCRSCLPTCRWLHKKLQQLEEKVEATPVANKKPPQAAVRQAEPGQGGNLAGHPRGFPSGSTSGRSSRSEIERAVEEISHLDSEIKQARSAQQPRPAGRVSGN